MTERDFKVKAGLKIEGGSIDFSNAQHATIDMDAVTTTNGAGKNISIKAGLGDGTGAGGKIVLHAGGAATSPGGSGGATSHVQALTIQPGGTVHIGTNGVSSTITSTGSTINATTVGSHSHASGKFTTLQATSTSTLTLANTDLVTVNGTDRNQMTLLQVNGTAGDGTTNNLATTERDYGEVRIRQKMGDTNLVHSRVEYMGGSYIIDNNDNGAGGTGQGVVFTVGNNGASGSSAWGVGRQAATGKFAIGYSGKNYDNIKDSDQNPMRSGQEYLVLDTSGNLALTTPNASLTLTSNSGAGQTEYTTAFKGSASATGNAIYTLPSAHAGANDYVLTAQTDGTLAWAASASGADGMGAGFQLEDDDGTELAITTSKEVKFIGEGITTNWSDVSHGIDSDPYDMTFTLDINDLSTTDVSSSAFLGTDSIAFVDASASGDPTRKGTIAELSTLLAGTGLTHSHGVISLDLDGLTDIADDLVGSDSFAVYDASGTATKSATLTRLGALLAGTNISANTGELSVATASATVAGIVELATITETNTGTDAARAVTPDGLADWTGGNSAITKLGTIATGTWNGTKVASAYLDDDTAHLGVTQTFTGTKTFSAEVDMNAGATIDGATISLDATTSLNIDNSDTTNGISIGTSTSGVPVTIGHGISEVTFGDNVTITGNLTVNGDQTVINTTAIVAEDKSMILGIAGGMEDATFARSSAVVTITSASHGMADGESVYVSNMGNSITDGVYTVSSVATNTFVLDGHGTSGTVGAGATMQHSSANVTEATADGSGIFAPGTSLHSIQYDSSNGWTVGDDLDITSGHHLSFAGTTTLTATALGSNVASSNLTSVGTLTSLTVDNIEIDGATIGHTNDTDLITLASAAVTLANNVDFNVAKAGGLQIAGTAVTSDATELNLVDGCSAGTITNSKAAITSSVGQVNGTTLGVDSVSVLAVNSSDSAASSSGAAITVFSMDKTAYRAAKVVLSVELLTTGDATAAKYEMMEILVHFDGSAAHHTTYAHMSTNATDLATITTAVSGDNVLIKYDPVGTTTENFKFRVAATQLVL